MSTLITTSISGIVDPVRVHGEYSTPLITTEYQNNIVTIAQIFDTLGIPTTGQPGLRDPTVLDAHNIQVALSLLDDIAQNGIDDPNGVFVPDPNNPTQSIKKSFLTLDMAQALDQIKKSLKAVGFDQAIVNITTDPSQVINALKRWKDLSDIGLFDIVQNALNATKTNRTLQAMLELEYVKAGNELIFDSLSSLKEGLTATQDILEKLKVVQDLHNLVSIQSRDSSGINAFTSGNPVTNLGLSRSSNQFSSIDDYSSNYTGVADPIFSAPLTAVADNNPTTATIEPISAANLSLFNQLKTQLPVLITKLDQLNGQTPTTRPEGSLAGKLQKILDDLNGAAGATDADKFASWVKDGYGDSTNASTGNIQRSITEAVTSAESLNDQQKEELRRQMFVFEEFYKSASSALSAISQLIVKMAQGISR